MQKSITSVHAPSCRDTQTHTILHKLSTSPSFHYPSGTRTAVTAFIPVAFHMLKLSHFRLFKCKVSPQHQNQLPTQSGQMSSMAQTQLLSCSFGRQVTLEAKKQINLTKQTHCRSQVLLFAAPSPEEYLLLVVCLSWGEEKARQEILGEKQHFPQFFLLSVDHSLLIYNASWLIIMNH